MAVDVVFILLMVLACFKGFRRGFIIAVFSLLAYFIGLAAAIKLSASVAAGLSAQHQSRWWPVLAFVIVFLAFVIAVNLVGKLIQRSFEAVMLGGLNRLAGAVIFALTYLLIFSVVLFYAVQIGLVSTAETTSSVTYPFLKSVGPRAIELIGRVIPIFKNLFTTLQHFFSASPSATAA